MQKNGIVAFAFGQPWYVLPNLRILESAQKRSVQMQAPIFTQLDIGIDESDFCVTFATQKKTDGPPPTLRIAREAVQWAIKNGITQLWVICARPHWWRCKRDLRFAIREAKMKGRIKARTPVEIMDSERRQWFTLKSTQPRTRSFREWEKRESILRRMPMILYKAVAS
jgi:hypothetical protein